MRRITWTLAMMMCVVIVLAGCGKKDASDVVAELDKTMDKLESYEGAGTMILHTGMKPQEYSVDVWYQSPSYYRIALKNATKDVTQIVLKNDEGVFVLTPQLNKSFRFQSDWPEKQGQAYLYHTLTQSILQDKNRQFTTEGDTYVFDVVSNLQNHSLVRQRIWLDKEDYAPRRMEASDAESNVLLEVNFSSFVFNKKFDEDSFDMERNMLGYELQSVATMAEGDEADGTLESAGTNAGTPTSTNTGTKEVSNRSFGILMPTYLPEGVVNKDISEIKLAGEAGIMLRYEGDYSFTLIEARPTERAVSALSGTMVDLGFTMATLLGNEKRTLTWMDQGVEFRLSTGDLPEEEMIMVAQSLEDQIGK
ncbi:MAG: outer membrane lipoprotein carrier protein LolA [Paenibacillaceae bacterium]